MMTEVNTNRRLFSKSEKTAAFVAFGGKCASCGCDLDAGWHGDHVEAYSKGGATNVDNIQPLCESCSIKKGVKSVMPWPDDVLGYPPRQWQENAFSLAIRTTKQAILIHATPGAGKTQFAASVVAAKINMGYGARVLVVSPGVNLRESWADDFSKFGLELDPDSAATDREARDCIGRSLTYAALSKVEGRIGGSDVERIRQRERATIVVLDEIHHAAYSAAWGAGILHACENAPFILCLSGTPFRSDGNPIPFVHYNEKGEAEADFTYTYAQSIQDDPQVCRQVYFPSYEGDMEWLSRDELHRHSFSDELDDKGQSERLRAALWSEDWVVNQLNDARQKLSQIRMTHSDAGGLIVAIDQQHANFLADVMRRVSSSRPLVIGSDDRDAHAKLIEFKTSPDPWVIAIKMISEGVNIPRLRVCSYMSNIVTEMFFRQVVGRILRFVRDIEHQEAFMFIPADRRLVEMAMAMRSERILAVQGQQSEPQGKERDGKERQPGSFRPLFAEGRAFETISFDGEVFSVDEIDHARELARPYGIHPEVMARMMRDGLVGIVTNGAPASNSESIYQPLYRRKRSQRGDKKTKAMRSEIRNRWLSHIADEGAAFQHLNSRLNRAAGARSGGNKTEDERAKIQALLEAAIASQEVPSWL